MLPRSRELLHEIVAAYIETGEPVASRSIARRRDVFVIEANPNPSLAADEDFAQAALNAGVPTTR